MPYVKAVVAGLFAWGFGAAVAAGAPPPVDDPNTPAWSVAEVDGAVTHPMASGLGRAGHADRLGCRRDCARLQRVFDRLVVVARAQTPRGAALAWSLTTVAQPDVTAFSMPDGRIAISASFVDLLASDEALAFVLAHEMAHAILEHERRALTFARQRLSSGVARSDADIHVELDVNIGLLTALQPLMQQSEHEADAFGWAMAAAAGFAPDRQLAFVEAECRAAPQPPLLLVETHPPPCRRLQALRGRVPPASPPATPAPQATRVPQAAPVPPAEPVPLGRALAEVR